MASFATGAAIAAASTSQVFVDDPRRPVRYGPNPMPGNPGETEALTGATQTGGEGPPVPHWNLQKWRPASVMGSNAEPSREAVLYSGGQPGWNSQQGTGLNDAIYGAHAQRIARLFTSHMSGSSGLSGQMSTQHSADGTAGLSGHAPILAPAVIPKLRSRQGYLNPLNRGGIANGNTPAIFVPVGELNSVGTVSVGMAAGNMARSTMRRGTFGY